MSSNSINSVNNVNPIQRSSVLGSMLVDTLCMGALGVVSPYAFLGLGKEEFVKIGKEVIDKHKDDKAKVALKDKLGELFDLREQHKLDEVYKNNKELIKNFKEITMGIKHNRALASFKWTLPIGAFIGLIFGLINRHFENKAIERYKKEQVK